MKKVLILFLLFVIALGAAIGLSYNETRKGQDTTPAENRPTDETAGSSSSQTEASGAQTETETPPASNALSLEVTSPVSGTISGSSVAVTGKTAPGAYVLINEYEMKADATGAFSKTVTLDEGENYISIIAYTDEGGVAETELMIVRE